MKRVQLLPRMRKPQLTLKAKNAKNEQQVEMQMDGPQLSQKPARPAGPQLSLVPAGAGGTVPRAEAGRRWRQW